MCKAKAWVLALTAGLLLLLIPAQARADVTRLLILNDEQTSETSAAATDVLRRFALYSSWTCTFVSSEDVPDTDGYTAVIICTDPNRALNASVALAIQESKLPVFVIGAGGLAELTKTQVHEGSLTLRLQTQANAANDMLLSGNSLLLMKKSGESLGGQIFVIAISARISSTGMDFMSGRTSGLIGLPGAMMTKSACVPSRTCWHARHTPQGRFSPSGA